MLTSVVCASCGKTVAIGNSVLFQGRTFCSQECKENFLKKTVN